MQMYSMGRKGTPGTVRANSSALEGEKFIEKPMLNKIKGMVALRQDPTQLSSQLVKVIKEKLRQ